jgi:hypothetical protein
MASYFATRDLQSLLQVQPSFEITGLDKHALQAKPGVYQHHPFTHWKNKKGQVQITPWDMFVIERPGAGMGGCS